MTVKLPRPRPLRGCFVTGTGTGVGKTVVAAALVAVLRARAIRVAVQKPVITGLDEPASADWPHDHQLLAQAAGVKADQVVAARFGPAVSPHLAARLSGAAIDAGALVAGVRDAAGQAELVVVEGVGGLMVPLTESYDVRCLARDLGLPLVVAAPPGLGTINHTLLTLAAAREAGLTVLGVVLTPWPRAPTALERSNQETIARLGSVAVATLPAVARAAPQLLAGAGGCLPIGQWFGLPGEPREARTASPAVAAGSLAAPVAVAAQAASLAGSD